MPELNDYSGPFKPDLKPEDFSREGLIRWLRAAARIYGGIDQLWHGLLIEELGQEKADELQMKMWYRKGGGCDLEVKSLTQEMNFSGDDVASHLKMYQLLPFMQLFMDIEYDLKDRNHALMTVRRCAALGHYEKTGEMERLRQLCTGLEQVGFQEGARRFNPKMKVTALKLPPRESKDDICCQWEFKTEEECDLKVSQREPG